MVIQLTLFAHSFELNNFEPIQKNFNSGFEFPRIKNQQDHNGIQCIKNKRSLKIDNWNSNIKLWSINEEIFDETIEIVSPQQLENTKNSVNYKKLIIGKYITQSFKSVTNS